MDQANIDEEDRALLSSAHAYRDFTLPTELSAKTLQDISARDGVDLATAVLFDRIQNSSRKLSLSEPQYPEPVDLVIVPGAFHKHHAHSGADGQRVIDLAPMLGWQAHRVPLGSFAPTRQNAAQIHHCIKALKSERILIVSLSKGGLDVKTMFTQTRAAGFDRRIIGWINISGIVSGTPLVDWLEARPIRCLGVKGLLRLRGQSFETVRELRRPSVPAPWPLLPPWMKIIHVVGFPLSRHLAHKWAPRGYARLLPLGPNDGGGILLADVLDWPGHLFPVWGADHYLQPQWNLSPLLLSIFREAASPVTTA